MSEFDAETFMNGYSWAKWSDCQDMVQDAFDEGFSRRSAEVLRLTAANAELEAERDQLKAINAELLKALRVADDALDLAGYDPSGIYRWIVRATIAKAGGRNA